MSDPCLAPTPRISLDLVGSPGALEADIIPSADADNGVELRADGLWTPGRPPTVSVLPVAPVTGDEIYFNADPANNVFWHLRYNASDPSGYGWAFLGGPMLTARRQQQGSMSPGGAFSWDTLAGSDVAGPSITAPLAGLYDIEFGCRIASNSSGNQAEVGASPVGSDPSAGTGATNAVAQLVSVSAELPASVFGALTAGEVIRLMYRCDGSGGTATFDRRWLKLLPRRVG